MLVSRWEKKLCAWAASAEPRATGSRGRRVGGHVELGRVKLAGRGIGPVLAATPYPSASLIVELARLFEQAAGIVITAAVHQRSSPGSVHPSNGLRC